MANRYRTKLVYRPGDDNDDVIAQVKKFDSKFFAGCVTEPYEATFWWYVIDTEDNDKIIGYAGMRYLDDERFGYFSRAGILERHRGKGLHKRLIVERIKMARRLNGEGVITYVAPHNNASMNALISRGFRLYTPQRAWAGPEFLYLRLEF